MACLLAESWHIGGEVNLPICSPFYEGHAGLLRLELCSGISLKLFFYRGEPKAGTSRKMLSVPFVFSTSCFQGPTFGCDKIVVIVTLLR